MKHTTVTGTSTGTITGTITHGIALGGTYGNSITIAAGGEIAPVGVAGNAASYSAPGVLVRPALADATIVNNGTISGAAPQSVSPYGGGGAGLAIYGAGAQITNTGLIMGGGLPHTTEPLPDFKAGTGVILHGAHDTLTNSGTILGGYAAIYNSNSDLNIPNGTAVTLGGVDDLLVNSGTIAGAQSAYGVAVIAHAGSIVNTGLIFGGVALPNYPVPNSAAVILQGDVALNNSGTIQGGYFYAGAGGIDLSGGASILNTGFIGGGMQGYTTKAGYGLRAVNKATIVNMGTIASGQHSNSANGVLLDGAGVTLQNAGLISGGYFYAADTAGPRAAGALLEHGARLTNTGTITSAFVQSTAVLRSSGLITGGVAVDQAAIFNTGTIETTSIYQISRLGVEPAAYVGVGGLLNNAGLIIGASNLSPPEYRQTGDAGVLLNGASGVFQNTGTVQGGADTAAGAGLVLQAGQAVNAGTILGGASTGGTDSVAGAGAHISGGTLTTSGLIAGGLDGATRADAVLFTGAGTLAITAGAHFEGDIAATPNSNATLELLTSAHTGTLAGLGSTITGIANITEALGASWTISNPTGLAAGSILTVNGDLTIAGNFTDAGTAIIGFAGTLATPDFSSLATLSFAGPGELLLGPASLPVNAPGLIEGFSTGDTLAITGLQTSGFSYSDGTLTLEGPRGLDIGAIAFSGNYTQSDFSVQGSLITYVGPSAHT